MSWNTGLQVNNLATKLNNLSNSVITNPLASTLNANNQGISNVSNIAIQSLKDSTGTNGTTDQILTVAPSGLSVWKSPIVSTVFYVDGTSGSNANLGSQSFPFKTIQYALNKCTDNTIYYTVYVNPYNTASGYGEALTISNARLNLIGVQSTVNTKSVSTTSINITTIATNPTLDIISIQNFVIGTSSLATNAINISNTTSYGGYSLYINNCEIIAPPPQDIISFRPNILTTRLYISRCNINNVNGVSGQLMINMQRGQLWQFDNNNVNNNATLSTLGTEVYPLYIDANATISAGIINSNFSSDNQGMCIYIATTNSTNPFSIANNLFTFKTVVQGTGATNIYSCIVSSLKTTMGLINNTFINTATTSALSQQPFILLNAGTVCVSRYNSFSMKYSPTNSAEAVIYPVGNYGTNATTNYYLYINGVYSNGSATILPIPNYPVSATVVSTLQTSDLSSITNLNNLVLTNKSNIVGYDTTTKLLTYQPNNTITGLASTTKTNVIGYDTGTGLLTYQPNNTITGLASTTKTNVIGYDTGTGLLTYQPASGSISAYVAYPLVTTTTPSKQPVVYSKSGTTGYASSGQAIPYAASVFISYSSSDYVNALNFTPVWGGTATNFPNLYFPSTGYYFIAWSFGTSNGNGGGNYSSINLNYLPSNSNEPYNDASAIVVANPGQNYTSFVNGVVKISTANTGGSSSPNGDFIVLAYQHVFTGGSVSNKQVLTIVKLGNL